MVGRICAGLAALILISFYVVGFGFPELFNEWSNKPGLLLAMFQFFLAIFVLVAAMAALIMLYLISIEEAFNTRSIIAVYAASFGIAWIILVISPFTLPWSWVSAFSVFFLGGLLSPGVAALVYSIWPNALSRKYKPTPSL